MKILNKNALLHCKTVVKLLLFRSLYLIAGNGKEKIKNNCYF